MKKFFTTYETEVLVPSFKWTKEHWKGLAILTIILTAIEAVIIFPTNIVGNVQKRINLIKFKRFAKKKRV